MMVALEYYKLSKITGTNEISRVVIEKKDKHVSMFLEKRKEQIAPYLTEK
jgi:hypothetical protein